MNFKDKSEKGHGDFGQATYTAQTKHKTRASQVQAEQQPL